jgi:hypothetical protein
MIIDSQKLKVSFRKELKQHYKRGSYKVTFATWIKKLSKYKLLKIIFEL